MWNDRLRFAERVENDWRALSPEEQASAMQALEGIDEDPILGAPLFEPLRGYWSYRAGHLRIVYRIAPEARFVVVLSIGRAAQ
jgi:mRNA-degrading endonuclease RelE of RelBE toxin-antitoxin system